MKRWVSCPGSFRLAAKGHNGTTSVHAATGTIAHELAERALRGEPIEAQMGRVLTVNGHQITVDQVMLDAVAVYRDAVRERTEGRPRLWVRHEERVCLDGWWQSGEPKPPVSLFGTADTLIYDYDTGRLSVIDYKHGSGLYVAADQNPQLLYYGAAALLLMRQLGRRVSTIELVVVQPRIPGRRAVRTSEYDVLDVLLWVDRVLKPSVAAVQDPDAPLIPGDHCRFCPARSFCPALVSLAQDKARLEFAPVDGEPLSPDALAEALDGLDAIEAMVEGIRAEARWHLEAGGTLQGWEMVPTRATRSWTDTNLLTQTLHQVAGSALDFFNLVPLSPAQMERNLTPEQWEKVKDLVQSKSSATKLARTNGETNV